MPILERKRDLARCYEGTSKAAVFVAAQLGNKRACKAIPCKGVFIYVLLVFKEKLWKEFFFLVL
jgi:hypothetical protein